MIASAYVNILQPPPRRRLPSSKTVRSTYVLVEVVQEGPVLNFRVKTITKWPRPRFWCQAPEGRFSPPLDATRLARSHPGTCSREEQRVDTGALLRGDFSLLVVVPLLSTLTSLALQCWLSVKECQDNRDGAWK